uniref:Uncharacterized protein n=2 Tax=Plectus sambesii TaxID=2011161 RepID=A0A914XJ02_9BILA
MAPGNVSGPRKGATALEVLEGVDLRGKSILITGGNQGIGFETARALVLKDAHVTIACRNIPAGEAAKTTIAKEKPGAKITLIQLDLTDLTSVEACAQRFIDSGLPLHVLILNAGVYNPNSRVTDAGFETTFQVNHLAQFYLTKLLTDCLTSSAPSRVVVVSSDAYRMVRSLTPRQVTWEKFSPTHENNVNSALKAYGLSKFANVLFAAELNRRLSPMGVTAYSLHPGVVDTAISRNTQLIQTFMCCCGCTTDSVEAGAATSVYVATTPELAQTHAGEYFRYCHPQHLTAPASNAENAAKLWALSEEMMDHYFTTGNGE